MHVVLDLPAATISNIVKRESRHKWNLICNMPRLFKMKTIKTLSTLKRKKLKTPRLYANYVISLLQVLLLPGLLGVLFLKVH
jgi:hypothetical protein